jgi:hypothetical protein
MRAAFTTFDRLFVAEKDQRVREGLRERIQGMVSVSEEQMKASHNAEQARSRARDAMITQLGESIAEICQQLSDVMKPYLT